MKKNKRNELTGTVISISRDRCKVQHGDKTVDCRLRHSNKTQIEPVVGDHVAFRDQNRGVCSIERILPRRNVLSRCDPRLPHIERIITVNIDHVVIVVSVKSPPLRIKLIDRYLVAAQLGRVEPIITVNKVDLLSPDESRELQEVRSYRDLGIEVIECSAATGTGIEALAKQLSGKTCAFVGHSGVGKSSLINALSSDLDLATNSVRKSDNKGRHTTTASHLYHLDQGISVIDTPGIREFAVFGITADNLRYCFTEFDSFARECRYADCSHISEPDCAVKTAVRDGLLHRFRYESYYRLMEDLLTGDINTDADSGSFMCRNCGENINSGGAGSEHRNHCPKCLYSVHLDRTPGDRAACCNGIMEPVSVWVRKGGEWAIIHRCLECGDLSSNRIAADDNEILLLSLAVRPLSQPAFPLDRLERLRE